MSDSSSSGFVQRHRNEIGLAIAVLAVLLFTTWVSTSYRDAPAQNAKDILRETALLGIFALGAGTVIIAGGIDLSSGSVIAFSGTIFCSVCILMAPQSEIGGPITSDLGIPILATAFLVTMFMAFLIGSFHTWLITVIELPPFVATLASLVGLRSLAKLLIQDVTRIANGGKAGNSEIFLDDDMFYNLANTWWIPVVVFIVLAFFLYLLLSKTVYGRHLYAMGGNEEAAKLSGIQTNKMKWLAYCIGSMTAAIAGILYTSYVGISQPTTDGIGYELNAIAAAVVGGCGLTGGIGSVMGIVLGSLFLKVVIDSVAKSFESRPDLVEGLVVGALVVVAVAFNELRGSSGVKKQFFPGTLGILNVFILTALAGTITYVTSADEGKLFNGCVAAGGAFLLLGLRAVMEKRTPKQQAA